MLYSDNQSAIALEQNQVFHSRTKHIDVHYNYIRDAVNCNEIVLRYMPTGAMIADILTKALDRNKHQGFVTNMRMSPLLD